MTWSNRPDSRGDIKRNELIPKDINVHYKRKVQVNSRSNKEIGPIEHSLKPEYQYKRRTGSPKHKTQSDAKVFCKTDVLRNLEEKKTSASSKLLTITIPYSASTHNKDTHNDTYKNQYDSPTTLVSELTPTGSVAKFKKQDKEETSLKKQENVGTKTGTVNTTPSFELCVVHDVELENEMMKNEVHYLSHELKEVTEKCCKIETKMVEIMSKEKKLMSINEQLKHEIQSLKQNNDVEAEPIFAGPEGGRTDLRLMKLMEENKIIKRRLLSSLNKESESNKAVIKQEYEVRWLKSNMQELVCNCEKIIKEYVIYKREHEEYKKSMKDVVSAKERQISCLRLKRCKEYEALVDQIHTLSTERTRLITSLNKLQKVNEQSISGVKMVQSQLETSKQLIVTLKDALQYERQLKVQCQMTFTLLYDQTKELLNHSNHTIQNVLQLVLYDRILVQETLAICNRNREEDAYGVTYYPSSSGSITDILSRQCREITNNTNICNRNEKALIRNSKKSKFLLRNSSNVNVSSSKDHVIRAVLYLCLIFIQMWFVVMYLSPWFAAPKQGNNVITESQN